MDMLNHVVGLIQQIHDAEVAVSNMRDLLDTAWQQMLAEGRLLPDESPRREDPLLLEIKQPEVLRLPPPVASTSPQNQPPNG